MHLLRIYYQHLIVVIMINVSTLFILYIAPLNTTLVKMTKEKEFLITNREVNEPLHLICNHFLT